MELFCAIGNLKRVNKKRLVKSIVTSNYLYVAIYPIEAACKKIICVVIHVSSHLTIISLSTSFLCLIPSLPYDYER